MNHKSWMEERQIIQWLNEPQVMNRRKTDNAMAKWTTSHEHWFIWPLYYLSLFYSWLVVHLAIVLSVFLLFMACGSFGHCIICLSSIHDLWFIWPLNYLKSWREERQIIQWANEPQVTNRIKTDNAMAKWTTSHE
jgi:hypothetical protein